MKGKGQPSCGTYPTEISESGANTASVRAELQRTATFFWLRGKHVHTSLEVFTSSSCSFLAWHLLGLEPTLGQARERKDLFSRSPAPHVAALISISELVA